MINVRRQHGIALISILLVFALATVIAAEMMTRSHRDLRRSQHLFDDKQAWHYALSGEQYARQILYRDFVNGVDKGVVADRLDDIWAANFPPFDIDDGEMEISINDLQGRFNINNLIAGSGAINPDAVATLQRLGARLLVSRDYTASIADWIDRDDSARSGGAELESYTEGQLPANRPLVDTSELRLIHGMQADDYVRMEPFMVAIPKQLGPKSFDITTYNINTVDATLLEAVSGLSSVETKRIEDLQKRGGYDKLSEWLAVAGPGLNAISHQLSVQSAFFEVVVVARFRDRVCRITTQLYRDPDTGEMTVITRQIGAS